MPAALPITTHRPLSCAYPFLGQTIATGILSNGVPTNPTNIDSMKLQETKHHLLRSRLPLDPDDVQEIVSEFQIELDRHLLEIRSFIHQGKWEDVARSAHWLKGAGGTVGFDEFVSPASELEQLARRSSDAEAAKRLLNRLEQLAQLITK